MGLYLFSCKKKAWVNKILLQVILHNILGKKRKHMRQKTLVILLLSYYS